MKHKTQKKIVLRQRRSVTFGSLEPAQYEKVRRWILNTLRIVPVLSDQDDAILNFLGIDLDKHEDLAVAQKSGGRSDVESKVDALTEMLLNKKEKR
jgi:hypothetical protein